MNRVLVLGCCGAGKSTFARKLHTIIQKEVIHLDQHYWKENWTESTQEEWNPVVTELASKPEWIMDGNYGSSFDIRLPMADTIFYFDFPTWKCLWRITSRILKYRGTTRPDMAAGCDERFDLEFYHYVATFNFVQRKKLLEKISAQKDKQIVIFRNDRESEAFLENLKSGLIE